MGVYGLAGVDFAAEDVGCVVYDGEGVGGAAESLCGVQAGPCAVEVPDWLLDGGHCVGLVCGMLVGDRWRVFFIEMDVSHALFNIDEHLGEHFTRELCGERARDCMCFGGGNDVVFCFSTAGLVEDILQKRKGICYREREHVLERAYLWVYRDSSNAGT